MAICGLGCRQATGSMRTAGTLAGARSAGTANVGVASDHHHTLPGGRGWQAGESRATWSADHWTVRSGPTATGARHGCRPRATCPVSCGHQRRRLSRHLQGRPAGPQPAATTAGTLRCDGSAQRRQARTHARANRVGGPCAISTPRMKASSKPRRAWSLVSIPASPTAPFRQLSPPACNRTNPLRSNCRTTCAGQPQEADDRAAASPKASPQWDGLCGRCYTPADGPQFRRSGSAQKFLSRPLSELPHVQDSTDELGSHARLCVDRHFYVPRETHCFRHSLNNQCEHEGSRCRRRSR